MFSQSEGSLQFLPKFNDEVILAGTKYELENSQWFEFSTLRFYISDLTIYSKGKTWFDPQKHRLMDIEDSSSFYIKAVPHSIDSISFYLGIDSVTNVSGILEGDLDPIKGMYWAWNSGYINFKLEGRSSLISSNPTKNFEFHLGGYLKPFSTIRKVDCVAIKEDGRYIVPFDLSIFLNSLDLNEMNSIMIPGMEASEISNLLPKMFELKENE